MAAPRHIAVMPGEVLEFLASAPGQTVVDATVGGGGHSKLILEKIAPGGKLIGLDRDPTMLELAAPRLQKKETTVVLVNENFDQIGEVLKGQSIQSVDGMLADLGISSDQLDRPERGFSFQEEGPLDMRMDPRSGEPASRLVQRLSERDLADLFWRYGEERYSRRIARRIVETRKKSPIETTTQLKDLVRRSVPKQRGGRERIDPATRVFQALRIAVNDELGALGRFLEGAGNWLKPGGRLVVISFHSLEDRLVKQAFREAGRWEVLTRKPVRASEDEVRTNPRARSAKLRAAQARGNLNRGEFAITRRRR
jgi:16S rRNA (cytosine1402-N4)-methyltransferase